MTPDTLLARLAAERTAHEQTKRELADWKDTAAERQRFADHWAGEASRLQHLLDEVHGKLVTVEGQLRTSREQCDDMAAILMPETWWDDDLQFDSPEEAADDMSLAVGDEFDLQAAVYWPEKYRVTKIDDEGEYECERIAGKPMVAKSYAQIRAELAQAREQLRDHEEREAACCPEDVGFEEYISVLERRLSKPWMPMESAPIDGTRILVDFGQRGVHAVSWKEGKGIVTWCVDDSKHGPWPLRGYIESDVKGWQPLPAAPTVREGE